MTLSLVREVALRLSLAYAGSELLYSFFSIFFSNIPIQHALTVIPFY